MRYVYASESLSFGHDGGVINLKRGQVWYAEDPVVKQHPEFFSDEPPIVHGRTPEPDRPVEDTTAEPGRKRHTK